MRLLESLNQFKSLEEIHITEGSSDVMSLIDYVLHQNPSLHSLLVYCSSNNRSKFSFSEVSNRAHNLSSLLIPGSVNDSQIIDYIVHSFPKLNHLLVVVGLRLDITACAKLLNYLPKINRTVTCRIPWGHQIELDTIGSFWKTISQDHLLSVAFEIVPRPTFMVIRIIKGRCWNDISTSGPEQFSEAIEKYGCYMHYLSLSGVDLLSLSSQQLHNERPGSLDYDKLKELHNNCPLETFLNHEPRHELLGHNPLQKLLDGCVELKHLIMRNIAFTSLNFPYRDLTIKKAIESLHLDECTFQNNSVFRTLSSLFSNIEEMGISQIAYAENDPLKRKVYSNIEMMETDIDDLLLSTSAPTNDKSDVKLDEEDAILVSITIKSIQTCYYYDFKGTNDGIFKPMAVENYINCINFRPQIFNINIHCKSLNYLLVKHKGKELELFINEEQ
ncbi:unnamed protein product [Mucor hiemalis]